MKLYKKSDTTISISSDTIVRSIVYTVAAFILLQFIFSITHQLRLIGVSAFLALALNPAVSGILNRLKIKSRVRAVGLAYVVVISTLMAFMALIVPPLVSQTSRFVKNIPSSVESFQSQDTAIARFVRSNNLDEQLTSAADDLVDRFGGAQGALDTASRVGGTLISFITVLVLTFMMLVEGPSLIDKALRYVPASERKKKKIMIKKMYNVVTAYVNGQVLIASIAAGFAMLVLLIASSLTDATINIIALTGIVFIFGLIPLIGNILAASLVVLFSLFSSTTLAIIMAVFFIIYQQVENATLQPYIQSKSNELTPLIVFVAAIIGAGVGGLLGALAAIPFAGCLRVWLLDRYPVDNSK